MQFKSLTDAIDTGTASGRFFFHVMASLAEMERELTIERTRAGLEVARKLGRKGGLERQMTESKIKSAGKLLASGVPQETSPATSASPSLPSTDGFQPPATLSVLYCPVLTGPTFKEGILTVSSQSAFYPLNGESWRAVSFAGRRTSVQL